MPETNKLVLVVCKPQIIIIINSNTLKTSYDIFYYIFGSLDIIKEKHINKLLAVHYYHKVSTTGTFILTWYSHGILN